MRIKEIVKLEFLLLPIFILNVNSCYGSTKEPTEIIPIINIVLTAIGLILLAWYQRYQMQILKKEIESQKAIFKNLKDYSEIINIKKIEEYVDMREKTFIEDSNLKISKHTSTYFEKIEHLKVQKNKLTAAQAETGEKLDVLTVNAVERIFILHRYVAVIPVIFNYHYAASEAITDAALEEIDPKTPYATALIGFWNELKKIRLQISDDVDLLGRSIKEKSFTDISQKVKNPEDLSMEKFMSEIEKVHLKLQNCVDQCKRKHGPPSR